MLDEETTTLEELFTSLRELDELEAIREELEKLLLDPDDELVELSLELRMTFLEELLDCATLEDDVPSAH